MARETDRPSQRPISQLRQRLGRSSRTAFVLSGGGNQAVAQVGMLRALLERDIVPDVIIGSSAGALNGATIAAAPSLRGRRAARGHLGRRSRGDEVFPGGAWRGRGTSSAATTTSSATRACATSSSGATPPTPSTSW